MVLFVFILYLMINIINLSTLSIWLHLSRIHCKYLLSPSNTTAGKTVHRFFHSDYRRSNVKALHQSVNFNGKRSHRDLPCITLQIGDQLCSVCWLADNYKTGCLEDPHGHKIQPQAYWDWLLCTLARFVCPICPAVSHAQHILTASSINISCPK